MTKSYIYIQFIVHLLTLLLEYKVVCRVKLAFILKVNLKKKMTDMSYFESHHLVCKTTLKLLKSV